MSQHLERMYFRNGIVLSLLLVLLLFVTDFPSLAVAQGSNVNIINLLYDTDVPVDPFIAAYELGFNYSISHQNSKRTGRNVNIIKMRPSLDQVSSSIEQAVGNSTDLFVVLGPGTEKITNAAYDALKNKDLVAFGPLLRSSLDDEFDEHFYHFLISREASAYTLLRHAVSNFRLSRIAIMGTNDASFGHKDYVFLQKLMKGMHRDFCNVFWTDAEVSDPGDEMFKKKWEELVKSRPQVVIVLGANNPATKLFITNFLEDPRTRLTDLMLANAEAMILDLWRKEVEGRKTFYNGRVVTAATYPDIFANKLPVSTSSLSAYKINAKERAGFFSRKDFNKLQDLRGGYSITAGFVAGEILFQALAGFNPALSRKEFFSSLFNLRTYFVEDMAIGTFASKNVDNVVNKGTFTHCNHGATDAYVREYVTPNFVAYVPEGRYSFSAQACKSDNLTLADPANIVTVNFTDLDYVKDYMISEITGGQEAGFFYRTYEAKHNMTLNVLQSNHDDSTRTLQKEYDEHWTNFVTGVIAEKTLDFPNIVFIDPFITLARKNKFRRNVIFLSPTVEQQIHVLSDYILTLHNRTVRTVTRSLLDQPVLDVLEKSLLKRNMTLTSSVLLKPGDKVEEELATSGLTFIIEVAETDIAVFIAHLERHKKARIAILFNSFSALYEKFYTAFNGTEAAERLLFATNLPHWADAKSPSMMIQNYQKSIVNSSRWSPMSLQSFIVGRVIRKVVDNLPAVHWSSVSNYIYAATAIQLDEMSFGPFTDSSSAKCTSESDPDSLDCAQNFGATSISVWPMSRVYDPDINLLFGPVTPTMEYPVPPTGMTRGQQAAIIVGSLVGAAVFAAIVGLLLYFICKDDSNAPKNLEDPVSLVFTDIQRCTALWAACPDVMPDALETHHRIIRRLISKYKCYEVKTVGDSFMIACKSPYAAVQLVVDMQRTFLQHDWGTSAIDDAYRKFEKDQVEEDAGYKPPTARLDEAVYREQWNGLRVRAAVHTGMCEIWHDEVTKGYDYYGTNSKTAARVESIGNGGQVLLTRAAYMALSTVERHGLNVTALGAVELRGVHEPVEMVQLNAVPGRAFDKLRLEEENDKFELETRAFPGREPPETMTDSLSPAAENVYTVMHDMLSPLTPEQRLNVLEPFCKQWNVAIPVTSNEKDMLNATRQIEQRLAMKSCSAVERILSNNNNVPDVMDILNALRGGGLGQVSSKGGWLGGSVFSNPVDVKASRNSEERIASSRTSLTSHLGSSVSSSISIPMREP